LKKLATDSATECSNSPFPDLCNYWGNNNIPPKVLFINRTTSPFTISGATSTSFKYASCLAQSGTQIPAALASQNTNCLVVLGDIGTTVSFVDSANNGFTATFTPTANPIITSATGVSVKGSYSQNTYTIIISPSSSVSEKAEAPKFSNIEASTGQVYEEVLPGYDPINQFYNLYQMLQGTGGVVTSMTDSRCQGSASTQLCSLILQNGSAGIAAAEVQLMAAMQSMVKLINGNLTTYTQSPFLDVLNYTNNSSSTDQFIQAFKNNLLLTSTNNFFSGVSSGAVDMLMKAYVIPMYNYVTQGTAPTLPTLQVTFSNTTSETINIPTGIFSDSFTTLPSSSTSSGPHPVAQGVTTFTMTSAGNDFSFSVDLSKGQFTPVVPTGTNNNKYIDFSLSDPVYSAPNLTYTIDVSLAQITFENNTNETITLVGDGAPSLPNGATTVGNGTTIGTIKNLNSLQFSMTASDFAYTIDLSQNTMTPGTSSNGSNFSYSLTAPYTIEIDYGTFSVSNSNSSTNSMTLSWTSSKAFVSPSSACSGNSCQISSSGLSEQIASFIPITSSDGLTLSGTLNNGSSEVSVGITVDASGNFTFTPDSSHAQPSTTTYTISGSYSKAKAEYKIIFTDNTAPPPIIPGTITITNNTGAAITMQAMLLQFDGTLLSNTKSTGKNQISGPEGGVYTIGTGCSSGCELEIVNTTKFYNFLFPNGSSPNSADPTKNFPFYDSGLNNTFIFQIPPSTGPNATKNWIYLDLYEAQKSFPDAIFGFSTQYVSVIYPTSGTAPTIITFDGKNNAYTITIPAPDTTKTPNPSITINNNLPYPIATNLPVESIKAYNPKASGGSGIAGGVLISNNAPGVGWKDIGISPGFTSVIMEYDNSSDEDSLFSHICTVAIMPFDSTGDNSGNLLQYDGSGISQLTNYSALCGPAACASTGNVPGGCSSSPLQCPSCTDTCTPCNSKTCPASSPCKGTIGNFAAYDWSVDANNNYVIDVYYNSPIPITIELNNSLASSTNLSFEPILPNGDSIFSAVSEASWSSPSYTFSNGSDAVMTVGTITYPITLTDGSGNQVTISQDNGAYAVAPKANNSIWTYQLGLPPHQFTLLNMTISAVEQKPSPQSITITNTTGYALQLKGLQSGDSPTFTPPSCGTVNGPNYEIAGTVTTSCEVSFTGSLPSDFTAITGVSTPGGVTLFSYPLQPMPQAVITQSNAVMTPSVPSPNNFAVTFAHGNQAVTITNSSATDVYMNTGDSAAFTSACAITPQNYSYKIAAKGSLSCTIQNLLNDANPISFKDANGNPQFSIDFTNQTPWNTSTPAITPQAGAEVVATYAGGSTSPSWTFTLADAAATETITIDNSTAYALQLTGLASDRSVTFSPSNCGALQGSIYVIPASTTPSSCAVTFAQTLQSNFKEITGVSTSTKTLFSYPIADLISKTPLTEPNAVMTPGGASPAYTLTISPQTVSINNTSTTDVYMNVNSEAFATGPTYTTGKGYLIAKNTTFTGTIQNLLNEPSANPGLVSFNDGSGTSQFTIDFTNQTPWNTSTPAITPQPGAEVVATYAGTQDNPVWTFTLADANIPSNTITSTLVGSITQLITDVAIDVTNPANPFPFSSGKNMMYFVGPSVSGEYTKMYMNFTEADISNSMITNSYDIIPSGRGITNDKQLLSNIMKGKLIIQASLTSGSNTIINLTTKAQGVNTVGYTNLTIDRTSSLFFTETITAGQYSFVPQLAVGLPQIAVTTQEPTSNQDIELASFPTDLSALPSSATFSLSIMNKFPSPTGMLVFGPSNMNIYSLYKFNTTPSSLVDPNSPYFNFGVISHIGEFVFVIALPNNPPTSSTNMYGKITITDHVIFNIGGNGAVTGSIEQISISSANASVWIPGQGGQSGVSAITISGTLPNLPATLSYTDGIQGSVNLTFE